MVIVVVGISVLDYICDRQLCVEVVILVVDIVQSLVILWKVG